MQKKEKRSRCCITVSFMWSLLLWFLSFYFLLPLCIYMCWVESIKNVKWGKISNAKMTIHWKQQIGAVLVVKVTETQAALKHAHQGYALTALTSGTSQDSHQSGVLSRGCKHWIHFVEWSLFASQQNGIVSFAFRHNLIWSLNLEPLLLLIISLVLC